MKLFLKILFFILITVFVSIAGVKYLGKTVYAVNELGEFKYGDQFGKWHNAVPLPTVEVTARMSGYARAITELSHTMSNPVVQAIYQGQNDFWELPVAQVTVTALPIGGAIDGVMNGIGKVDNALLRKGATAAKGGANLIPKGKLANHLFKGTGKLADNPANRALIQKISNGTPLGIDVYGKAWYSGVDASGNLIYSYTQNGVVKGAGYMNMTLEEMVIKYGLK